MVHTLYIIILLKAVNNNENTNLSLMQDQTNLFQLEKDKKNGMYLCGCLHFLFTIERFSIYVWGKIEMKEKPPHPPLNIH